MFATSFFLCKMSWILNVLIFFVHFISLPLILISLIFEVHTLQLQIQQAFSKFPFEKDRSSCIEQAGKEKFTCSYYHSDKVNIAYVDSFLLFLIILIFVSS